MDTETASPTSERNGTTEATITREVVRLTKEIAGRGPVKGKTYMSDECVLVLLRDGHTTSEATMAGSGRQRQVAQTRVDLNEDERQRFVDVIEQHTGRKVIGFMSSSQQDPSLISQVYVLDTSPLVDASF
jgi:uncharacterized protein YbcI